MKSILWIYFWAYSVLGDLWFTAPSANGNNNTASILDSIYQTRWDYTHETIKGLATLSTYLNYSLVEVSSIHLESKNFSVSIKDPGIYFFKIKISNAEYKSGNLTVLWSSKPSNPISSKAYAPQENSTRAMFSTSGTASSSSSSNMHLWFLLLAIIPFLAIIILAICYYRRRQNYFVSPPVYGPSYPPPVVAPVAPVASYPAYPVYPVAAPVASPYYGYPATTSAVVAPSFHASFNHSTFDHHHHHDSHHHHGFDHHGSHHHHPC